MQCSVELLYDIFVELCLCDSGENCALKLCRLKGGYLVSGFIVYAEMVVFGIFC